MVTTSTDNEIREPHKGLQVPKRYDPFGAQEDKIIYALAQLCGGTVTSVIGELDKLEPGILNAQIIALTKTILTGLFEQGLLTGHKQNGLMYYNFHKIAANNGLITQKDLAS